MKKAGEIISLIFQNKDFSKAKEYSELFTGWNDIVGERIAAHSNIKELEKNVVIIEVDHPGWLQIIQINQYKILVKLKKKYPELKIIGIALRLKRNAGD